MAFTQEHIIPLIKTIKDKRFFESERGFQGQLLALLDRLLKENNLFPNETILEQEYQKTMKHHGIRQRPDIIIHVPIEAGLTIDRTQNNFYVIALKLRGNAKSANEDFSKLDDMFDTLNYPEGVFINIGAYPAIFLGNYEGEYKDRLHELSVSLNNDEIQIRHSMFGNQEIVSNDV